MKAPRMGAGAVKAAPLIKYKTGYNAAQIDEVQCTRESAACVWFAGTHGAKKERREAKVAGYARYHDSWAAAHAYLLERAEGKVAHCRMTLESLKGTLGNVKGMKPPAGAK